MRIACLLLLLLGLTGFAFAEDAPTLEEFRKAMNERAAEAGAQRAASPYHVLATDYFSRFSLDPEAQAGPDEVQVDESWALVLPPAPQDVTRLMSGHLRDFMVRSMQVALSPAASTQAAGKRLVLREEGGGKTGVAESFTIRVAPGVIEIAGLDANGLRDGVIRLIDLMGLRQAPILPVGEQDYEPRLAVRVGGLGGLPETVLMGYNAVLVTGGSLYALSTSDAIPELADRRNPGLIEQNKRDVEAAAAYGLKTFAHINTVDKFPKDHPVFQAHPEIRGALTWKADGEYTLCTEHPLVQQWLRESVEGLFEAIPELDGIQVIIGGEGFYHCFMRPYGVEKGHTNCPRCEKLGAEQVVANLVNLLADGARKYNPEAVVLAWPYSAEHVWSADRAQTGMIEHLKPGTGVLTEMVKDEVVEKPGGIKKALWDYSIDLIGPGERAKQQIAACKAAGIPCRLLSMAEETFEASSLPNIPCMDRWMNRAEALVTSGAESCYIWQMGPYDGSVSTEAYKFSYWTPLIPREELMTKLAARVAGHEAGPYLRQAWQFVSDAIPYVPEIGSYYKGPHFFGPAHPMIADLDAEIPPVFNGYYLFLAEAVPKDAMQGLPTYFTHPTGDPEAFGASYDKLAELLGQAVAKVEAGAPLVPDRCRMTFDAEASSIRWFSHIARTEVNFTRSCVLRDRLNELRKKPQLTATEQDEARDLFREWRMVLSNELENARQALPVAKADARLDSYHRGDASFSHLTDMLEAKIELLEHEIEVFLPKVAAELGIEVKA